MNSLRYISGLVKKTLFAAAIVSCFAIALSAQTVDPHHQGKMYGDPDFSGEPTNLSVVNTDIRDILSYLTDQYGINFIIDKSVKEVPVTVKVNEVPWNVALDSILQAQGLGVQVNGSILRIADNTTLAAEGELLRQKQNNQIDTSPLVTELVRLNYATAAGAIAEGKTTSGTTATNAASNSSGNSQVGNTEGGDGLLPIIKRRLSRRGSIEIDSRSNSLIITDVPKNVAAVKQLIAILDQPEPQVEIEARIVVASRSFSRDIGVQLTALLSGRNGAGIGGGTLPNTPSGVSLPLTPNPTIANDLASRISNTAIGLTTGVFGTAQLSAMISAGEQKGQAKVIATPRITTLNNRPAEITSKTQIPISTIQPGATANGVFVVDTKYVDVPLRLAITPQITDLGTVILNVVAENSSAPLQTGGQAPVINTQSMTTQVTVPDGGTTVVGGVLFDDERESQDRTPGLASIPVLGNLFKRKGISRNTNEILFFITPRISRPDYAAGTQDGIAPKPPTIIQPVPMANPPSNSSPVAAPTPVVATPTLTSPVVLPAVSPDKP